MTDMRLSTLELRCLKEIQKASEEHRITSEREIALAIDFPFNEVAHAIAALKRHGLVAYEGDTQ